MRKQDEQKVLTPGPVEDANLTILAVLMAAQLNEVRYLVKYDCCCREGIVRHESMHKRIQRISTACHHCNREKQAAALRDAKKQKLISVKADYFPMTDALLGEIAGPPVWEKPPSAVGGMWADRSWEMSA